MDNRQICFIICANDDRYVEEALYYIILKDLMCRKDIPLTA